MAKPTYQRQFRDTTEAAHYFRRRNYRPLSGPDAVLMRPLRYVNGKRIITFAHQETSDGLVFKFIDVLCKGESEG